MSNLRQAAQQLVERIYLEGASPLDWHEYTALKAALAEPDGPCPTCVSLARTVMMDQAGQA